jgi:hypothetical protein
MALASCVAETTGHQHIFGRAAQRLPDGTTLTLSLSKGPSLSKGAKDLGWGNARNGLAAAPAQTPTNHFRIRGDP